MSPTLLKGVAVVVAIIVAWQIGVRIAPDIVAILQRAIDQLNGSNARPSQPISKQNQTVDSSATKEEIYDPENRQH